MPRKNKRIFISDTHITKKFNPEPGKYDYTWLSAGDATALTNFLNHLNARADVEEVVLIGDLFDNWIFPVDVEPPSIDKIIGELKASGDSVIQALVALCDNPEIRVLVLPGNHDMELTASVVKKHFPALDGVPGTGMVFGGSGPWNLGSSVYRSSRLRAEHGSAHAMFNAPDPLNNPGSRLPMGYYVSRVVATKTYNTGHGDRHWWTYVDDMLEAVGPAKFAPCVFEAVLEEANLNQDIDIVMPKINGQEVVVKASQIRDKYMNLYDQWQERFGAGIAFKSVLAEIGYLDDAADRLCKMGDTNIVIFGHSHDWELDKDSWFVDDRIYANCGTWCDTPKKPRTYVELETSSDRRKRKVRVMEWDDTAGNGKKLKESWV